MRPDLAPLDARDRRGRPAARGHAARDIGPEGPTPAQLEAMQTYADARARRSATSPALYVARPLPVDFRVNVNPFVIWIWIGGAIAVVGALIAIWPAPEARRRRVSDVYAARLARDLGRA